MAIAERPEPAVPALSGGDPQAAAALARPYRDRETALLQVSNAISRERAAARKRDQTVREAREAGCSWTEIGARLGVSAQAVQKRYGKS